MIWRQLTVVLDIFEYESVELKQVWFSDCAFHEMLIFTGWVETESRKLQEREGGGREIFRGTKEGLGRRGKGKAQTDFCPRDPPI